MIVRIWKVGIAPGQGKTLESFAREISLPMFRAQTGCLSVLFSRTENDCATISIWDSSESVAKMERSAKYQAVVKQIEESGILGSNHCTEVFEIYGGFVNHESLAFAN